MIQFTPSPGCLEGGQEPPSIGRDEAETMRDVCAFLALMLRYPDDTAYRDFGALTGAFAPLFAAYGSSVPEVVERQELQAEYVRLFVNNLGFVPAVPYASCHLDEGGMLQGGSYYRLLELMRRAGLALQDSFTEQADHVAVLFELCSELIDTALSGEGPECSLRLLAEVMRGYIVPSLEGLIDPLREHARYDFYPRMAELALGFARETSSAAETMLTPDAGENG
jgi:TorA maturation chaperone TorD